MHARPFIGGYGTFSAAHAPPRSTFASAAAAASSFAGRPPPPSTFAGAGHRKIGGTFAAASRMANAPAADWRVIDWPLVYKQLEQAIGEAIRKTHSVSLPESDEWHAIFGQECADNVRRTVMQRLQGLQQSTTTAEIRAAVVDALMKHHVAPVMQLEENCVGVVLETLRKADQDAAAVGEAVGKGVQFSEGLPMSNSSRRRVRFDVDVSGTDAEQPASKYSASLTSGRFSAAPPPKKSWLMISKKVLGDFPKLSCGFVYGYVVQGTWYITEVTICTARLNIAENKLFV